jgi:hypothetical protein
VVLQTRGENECSDGGSSSGVAVSGEECRRKRHKRGSETAVVCNTLLYRTLGKTEDFDGHLIGKDSFLDPLTLL